MKKIKSKTEIAPELYDLTDREVSIIDQESTGGEGWNFYCSSYINKPAVYRNKIFGRVKDAFIDYQAEIEFNQHEIMSSCTCSRSGVICRHVVALMYSWVYDKDAFTDIGRSLELVMQMDRERLLEVVVRILQHDPKNMDYFLARVEKEQVTEDISDVI